MSSYVLLVSAGYILLISICPMLKTGKLHSVANSSILTKLFKSYFKVAKIWCIFAQLYKYSIDCFDSIDWLINWIFILSRVNCVYEFPSFSPQ